ncbi:MAG TPA: hypothetical protein VIP46_17325 [Pyrinomonadaceae bacterium]
MEQFSRRAFVEKVLGGAPIGAQKLGDGTPRARRLDHKEAFRLYGNA